MVPPCTHPPPHHHHPSDNSLIDNTYYYFILIPNKFLNIFYIYYFAINFLLILKVNFFND